MTQTQMLTILRNSVNETDESVLKAYLVLAGDHILNKAFPFDPQKRDVPPKYHSLQIEIAAYLINKIGAEGETSHSENGVSRTYENASVPDSMLKGVLPFVGVCRSGGAD